MNRLKSDERGISAPVLEKVVPGPGKAGEKEGRVQADHDNHDDYDNYDEHNLSDYEGSDNDHSLLGVLDRFFCAPCPRQVWGSDGKAKSNGCHEVGWTELFVDLVFVGHFTVLAHSVEHCEDFSFEGLSWVWVNFTLMWGTCVPRVL
jgi:hypothetical protein